MDSGGSTHCRGWNVRANRFQSHTGKQWGGRCVRLNDYHTWIFDCTGLWTRTWSLVWSWPVALLLGTWGRYSWWFWMGGVEGSPVVWRYFFVWRENITYARNWKTSWAKDLQRGSVCASRCLLEFIWTTLLRWLPCPGVFSLWAWVKRCYRRTSGSCLINFGIPGILTKSKTEEE